MWMIFSNGFTKFHLNPSDVIPFTVRPPNPFQKALSLQCADPDRPFVMTVVAWAVPPQDFIRVAGQLQSLELQCDVFLSKTK